MSTSIAKGLILLSAIVFIIGACAIGHKYDYSAVLADIGFSGNAAVIVAVHDQRAYIISESKRPDFIGIQRQGWGTPGMPYDVCTENGKPLADNIAQAISQSLSKKGFRATPVVLSYADTTIMALNKLTSLRADRLVLVVIKEWKTDTMKYGKLLCDVTLKVLDSDKHVLSEKTVSSERQNIGTRPEVMAPRALKEKIEELMNDPSIALSLTDSVQKEE